MMASIMQPGFDALDAAEEFLGLLRRPSWHAEAACRGVGSATFFPGRGEPHSRAHALCAGCPVRAACLEAALATTGVDDVGIWAGTTTRDRTQMRHGGGKLPPPLRSLVCAWCERTFTPSGKVATSGREPGGFDGTKFCSAKCDGQGYVRDLLERRRSAA